MTLRKHNYKLQLQEHKRWLETELATVQIALAQVGPRSLVPRAGLLGEAEAYKAAIRNLEFHERQKQEVDEQIKASRNRDRKRKAEAKDSTSG